MAASLGTRLHLWTPLRPGVQRRRIYVENRLYDRIIAAGDYRIGMLWSDMDRFSLGGHITVGRGSEPTCMWKQLDPPNEEVWEIRSKDPKPQVRVFGRFWEADAFVATHAVYRGDLGFPRRSKFEGNNWPAEIRRCKRLWDQIFQGASPHSGNTVHDYITEGGVEIGRLR